MTKQELLDKANDLPLARGSLSDDGQDRPRHLRRQGEKTQKPRQPVFSGIPPHNEKTRRMVSQVDHFDTIFVSTEFEALILENSLIKQHMPRYNILLKDDKGYPFVRLARSTIRVLRWSAAAERATRDYGPFGGRHETRPALDAVCAALRLPTVPESSPATSAKSAPA